jgi:hypothetical protein
MNVYKLKSGKTNGAFQLPLRGILVPREIDGEILLKAIAYIPGASSFFAEDHKGDQKTKPIWFDDGEFRVSPDDKVLNELMQSHPWFNAHYVLVNEEATAKEEVKDFELLAKATNAIINEKDEFKLKAMAMVIISLDAATWDQFKCKAELLKYAKNHTKTLLAELVKVDYEGRLLAALAFSKGIVKYNEFQTAVLWNDDNEGIIVRVAEGESGVDKLGEFLSKKSDSSNLVMQRIGTKVQSIASINAVGENVLSGKSVEEIKAEAIAEYIASLAEGKDEGGKPDLSPEPPVEDDAKKPKFNSTNLVEVQTMYKTITGKEIPPRFKNDLVWLNAEINKGI